MTGLVQPGPDATADRSGTDEHVAGHDDKDTQGSWRAVASPDRLRTRISLMSVPVVFVVLLIGGVVVIGLLMLVALVVLFRPPPIPPTNG